MEIEFFEPGKMEDGLLREVVIAARYKGQWIFSGCGLLGGRREPGESIGETARRVLLEKTGAEQADIRAVSTYADGKTECGMLFFSEIAELPVLPGHAILTDRLPRELGCSDTVNQLFTRVQGWLNLQSSADELGDVYDEHRNLTGRLHRRGDPLPKGDYHLVVYVWILNSRGEFLLTKRSPNKGFPNLWESTGGSALAGDDSLTAAMREVREETGLTLDPKKGRVLFTLQGDNYFSDVWLFRQDFDLADVVLQEGETVDKMYADRETILATARSGKFVPCSYLQRLFEFC